MWEDKEIWWEDRDSSGAVLSSVFIIVPKNPPQCIVTFSEDLKVLTVLSEVSGVVFQSFSSPFLSTRL